MRFFKEMVKATVERNLIKPIMQKAEVFVFAPKNDGNQKHLNDDNYFTGKVDLPFPIVSFEFAGDTPITSLEHETRDGFDVQIKCMVVEEVEPFTYNFYFLVDSVKGIISHKDVMYVAHDSEKQTEIDMYNWSVTLLNEMVQRLGTEKMGSEPVREKFKVGTGKSKYFHKIKRVIHVAPKNIMNKIASVSTREIDWKHRWTSRGHWRNFYIDSKDHSKGIDTSKIGKDRDDNVCVVGRTWVSESIKGPEDKPVIKKQRVVV